MIVSSSDAGVAWGVVLALVAGACAAPASAPPQPPPVTAARKDTKRHPPVLPSYEVAIAAIAGEIERLRSDYPQLSSFSAATHCDRRRLVIEYACKTHRAQHRGGWTSGVPNPDEDGLWFYIDFHDPDSQAQIHTQPVVPELRYRDKRVMVLILEGARTRRVAERLHRILRAQGVRGATEDHEPPVPEQGPVQ